MADNYLLQLLGKGEKPIFMTRQHWLILLGRISPELALILLILVAVSATWITWSATGWLALGYLFILLPLVSLIRDVLIWSSHKHIVTNRRVLHMSGVISKNVTDSSLEKVNDVKMTQSMFGRMFDFGDVEILTASELGVNRFSHIAKPIDLKTAMLNAKAALDSGEHAVEMAMNIPDLIAELGDLHKQGVLTDEEFKTKKAELLSKI